MAKNTPLVMLEKIAAIKTMRILLLRDPKQDASLSASKAIIDALYAGGFRIVYGAEEVDLQHLAETLPNRDMNAIDYSRIPM